MKIVVIIAIVLALTLTGSAQRKERPNEPGDSKASRNMDKSKETGGGEASVKEQDSRAADREPRGQQNNRETGREPAGIAFRILRGLLKSTPTATDKQELAGLPEAQQKHIKEHWAQAEKERRAREQQTQHQQSKQQPKRSNELRGNRF